MLGGTSSSSRERGTRWVFRGVSVVEHLCRAPTGRPGPPGEAPDLWCYPSVNPRGLMFELYVVG